MDSTYIPLALYPRRGSRGISDIILIIRIFYIHRSQLFCHKTIQITFLYTVIHYFELSSYLSNVGFTEYLQQERQNVFIYDIIKLIIVMLCK
jgi:hypothetical protein